jgi:hypothetical protein
MKTFRTIHHVDQKTIEEMYDTYTPAFILTTGRSGSKFLATLMNYASNMVSYHEAEPRLQYFANYAFHHQDRGEVLAKMVDAARMELILDAYIKGKIFVECNQCLVFFAPVVSRLFKKTRFVHVVRHPGDFVRSAVRKGWHKNDSIWESGRIKMKGNKEWKKSDQLERLSWVWYATNRFVEDFKNSAEPGSLMTFKIEDLFNNEGSVRKFLNFVGAKGITHDDIIKIQNTKINELIIETDEPSNMKKLSFFPEYQKWEQTEKEKIKGYCNELAKVYGYQL